MHGSVMQLLDTRRSCSGGRSSTHEMNYVFPASHLPIASLVMSKLELGSVLQRKPRSLQVANIGFGQRYLGVSATNSIHMPCMDPFPWGASLSLLFPYRVSNTAKVHCDITTPSPWLVPSVPRKSPEKKPTGTMISRRPWSRAASSSS